MSRRHTHNEGHGAITAASKGLLKEGKEAKEKRKEIERGGKRGGKERTE